ncbi:MAG TPA: hypothetical protein VHZ49_05305 [Methylomirabilota bacterium]|nr:hypothetical protein [Methylomirabilota bacterium]
MRTALLAALTLGVTLGASAAAIAEPLPVRFTEGVGRAFPVLRDASGERIAQGDLVQIARGDQVENRLIFRFRDGSLYDETVVFSQRGVFTLLSYRLVQRGPSFPESLDATLDRETGRYTVRYRSDADTPEEVLKGKFEMPDDVYNGLLGTLMKNLPAGASTMVQIVAFTPRPRAVKMLLMPTGQDTVMMGETAVASTRFNVKPQLGLFASLLVTDIPDIKMWIAGGAAPAFLRFEGPLYFMGPIWKIDWN